MVLAGLAVAALAALALALVGLVPASGSDELKNVLPRGRVQPCQPCQP